jgi:hypothetical protein
MTRLHALIQERGRALPALGAATRVRAEIR